MAGSKRKSSGSDSSDVRKKAKVEPKLMVPLTIKTGVGHEKSSVAKISKHYCMTKEEAKGVFDLARDLRQDDPGIFITFQSGRRVRTGLQRGGPGVAAHRPCAIGASGAAALTNIKNWVTGLVAAPATVTPVGDQGLALGNMDGGTFGVTAATLSFMPNPLPNPWANSVLASGVSLGSAVSVLGVGRGSATIIPMPSIVFF